MITLEEGLGDCGLVSYYSIDHFNFETVFGLDLLDICGDNFYNDVVSASFLLKVFDFNENRFSEFLSCCHFMVY
jgi:hypothetical protein